MKKEDVPQEALLFGPWREVVYAVDEAGRYVLEPCAGWEPSNFANQQAWEAILEEAENAAALARAGKKSPLAVHMALHQMDPGLLARYAGLSRLAVLWHLTPWGFRRMGEAAARRYAALFGLAPGELARVPDRIRLPGLMDGGENRR